MAGKNQVVLTFAGDTKNLEDAFGRVGDGAKRMGDNADAGVGKLDRIGESADNNERRFTGLASGIDGVTTLLANPSPQELAQGIADIADGVANFGVGFAKMVGTFIADQAKMVLAHMTNAARMALGWLIAMGPIALVILAIGAIIGILALLGVDFDDVVGVFQAGWEAITGAASAVFTWLKTNWPLVLAILTGPFGLAVLAIARHKDKILGFIGEIPDKIGGLLSGIGDIFSGAFEGAFSAIKSLWNSTVGGFGFTAPSWIPGIGGKGFHIPEMHTGGIVPGAPGSETLALLQAGERVSPAGAADGSVVIDMRGAFIAGDSRQFEQAVVRALRAAGAKGTPITVRGRAL